MEISPAVPEYIIYKYKNRFKNTNNVAQPEIIEGFKKVTINKFEKIKLDEVKVVESKFKIDVPKK